MSDGFEPWSCKKCSALFFQWLLQPGVRFRAAAARGEQMRSEGPGLDREPCCLSTNERARSCNLRQPAAAWTNMFLGIFSGAAH